MTRSEPLLDGVAGIAWSDSVWLLGIYSIRMTVGCMLLPLFSADLLPLLIRMALYVSLGALAMCLNGPPAGSWQSQSALDWLSLLGREVLIGGALGWLFGCLMWGVQAAGHAIDAKIGATQSQLLDPLTGQFCSLNGTFLSQWGNWAFVTANGLLLWIGVVLDSYLWWPLSHRFLDLSALKPDLASGEVGQLFSWAVGLAAPCLLALFAIDTVLGLVGRAAPQFNLLPLSNGVKSCAAVVVILLSLNPLLRQCAELIHQRADWLHSVLPSAQALFR